MICAEFFTAHACLDPAFESMLQGILECLQDLDKIKNPVLSPGFVVPVL